MCAYGWVLSFALLLLSATAAPAPPVPRPLVIWHGMGDSGASHGMREFQQMVQQVHPGIFVHSISLGDSENDDMRASFYGNVNDQVDLVAKQLQEIPELNEHGIDCIGFSQGGQFLRAYVERYNDPPVFNLITFGSQHMGVSDMAQCKPFDVLCQLARRAAKSSVYSGWVQENIVQAQYFRDTYSAAAFAKYLQANRFLTDINGEVALARNATYAQNLSKLSNLVLVLFTEDKMVVPKESAWFGSQEVPSALSSLKQEHFSVGQPRPIISMQEQPLYIEDWIGLRRLDERGGVQFRTCIGEHMQIGDCWRDIILEYTGSLV